MDVIHLRERETVEGMSEGDEARVHHVAGKAEKRWNEREGGRKVEGARGMEAEKETEREEGTEKK